MRKIAATIDDSGNIIDDDGVIVCSGLGWKFTDIPDIARLTIKDLAILSEQGFEAKELIEMRKEGLL